LNNTQFTVDMPKSRHVYAEHKWCHYYKDWHYNV